MRRLFFVIWVLSLLTGCGSTPQMSREQWLAMTSREYSGVSREQVIAAAEQVLRLSDEDDFQLSHFQEGFMATRSWSVFLLVGFYSGTDYWTLKTEPREGRVLVSLQVNRLGSTMMVLPAPSGGPTYMTTPTIGAPIPGDATYVTFFSRMDYMLGKRKDWLDCAAAEARHKQRVTTGLLEPICLAITMPDHKPSGPLIAYQ